MRSASDISVLSMAEFSWAINGGMLMLSYIIRIIDHFQLQHGVQPNLLYLNELHMSELRKALANGQIASITDLLHMELVISKEITHPHVAWTQTAHRIAV